MDSNNPIEYKIPNNLAAMWSMMLPGLGQLLKGQAMPGIFWAIAVGGGYFSYMWPGLIFHALCILDAGFSEGKDSFFKLNTWQKKLGFLATIAGLLTYIWIRNF